MSLFDYMAAKTILEERPPLKNPVLEFELYLRMIILPFVLFALSFFSKNFHKNGPYIVFLYIIYVIFFLFRLGAVQKFPTLFQFALLMVIPAFSDFAEINYDWYQPYKTVCFFGWLISLPTYALISIVRAIIRRIKKRRSGETTVVPEPLEEPPRLSDKERIAELEKQLASIKNQVGLK